jgi:hypothetical protein
MSVLSDYSDRALLAALQQHAVPNAVLYPWQVRMRRRPAGAAPGPGGVPGAGRPGGRPLRPEGEAAGDPTADSPPEPGDGRRHPRPHGAPRGAGEAAGAARRQGGLRAQGDRSPHLHLPKVGGAQWT